MHYAFYQIFLKKNEIETRETVENSLENNDYFERNNKNICQIDQNGNNFIV